MGRGAKSLTVTGCSSPGPPAPFSLSRSAPAFLEAEPRTPTAGTRSQQAFAA